VIPGVRWIQFDLTDQEVSALQKLLSDRVEHDCYPLSLRIQALRRILAKFGADGTLPPPPGLGVAFTRFGRQTFQIRQKGVRTA
jgi:hypothetical protein